MAGCIHFVLRGILEHVFAVDSILRATAFCYEILIEGVKTPLNLNLTKIAQKKSTRTKLMII